MIKLTVASDSAAYNFVTESASYYADIYGNIHHSWLASPMKSSRGNNLLASIEIYAEYNCCLFSQLNINFNRCTAQIYVHTIYVTW